ncbi:MAG: (cytosine-5-)-methyltransferase [Anaerosolibacter sp.]|uniref:DNA cytosine methyltransferase n=1 Tax=Anaerosolibacter sp. TaxID=1872527 RepID=UPI0026344C58|nr:DNA cytosine methyltransferase [Anaerosolibacter sp.]MDF2546097.1 (cytosine-5-)-methyltransferase [Anaerosolibacter sp.]
MPVSDIIKTKKSFFNMTNKEFADALGLGRDGQNIVSALEKSTLDSVQDVLDRIHSFPNTHPFPGLAEGEERFTFIDLFCGIGGIRLPFQQLGGRSVFSSEIDKFAAKTYFANYGEQPHGDITAIPSENIPEHDILLAGFPCQPFSQAGLGRGFEDTRGTLFFEIERIIDARRPKAFLLENVKRLFTHDGGNTFRIICEHLDALRYTVFSRVLRAADYGVPQNRERIYIVGFDRDHIDNPDQFNFDFPDPLGIPTRVGDILDETVDEKYTISDLLWEGHLRRREEHRERGNGFGYSLFNADSPYTNTISARYYKDGSEILIDQGEGRNPRKLTPRECRRLQGFPEEFIIPVSDPQAYKQFGNSVAVPVVDAIARRMIQTMTDHQMIP